MMEVCIKVNDYLNSTDNEAGAGRYQNARTLVCTSTYNEAGNIDNLLTGVFSLDGAYDVMIVDDNSPDGTGKRLDEIAAENPKLAVIHRPSKLGIGSAHQLCLMYAIHHGYDRLVTMDADLSHDPNDIPRLLEKLGTADFVIGSRYAKGGDSEYTGYRRFLSVTANILARLVLQLPVKEFTTSLRAFDVALLKNNWHAKVQTNGYSFFLETVFRLHRSGFRITEVPIYFKDRAAGISKIPRLEIFNGVIKLLQLGGIAYLGFKDTPPPADVQDTCHHCQSPYLAENPYADKIILGSEANTASVEGSARCAKIKPLVVQCFECGSLHLHPLVSVNIPKI